jgi:hypothetical protein
MPRWRFYAVVATASAVTLIAAYIFDMVTDRIGEIIAAAIR